MLHSKTKKHLLEGKIPDDMFNRLVDACTAQWPEAAKKSERAVGDVVYRRHDNTVRYAIPWVSRAIRLAQASIIDLGCGCGSSSLAFAHFAKCVTGIEVDEGYVRAFNKRIGLFGVTGCECIKTTPEAVLGDIRRIMAPDSCILMLAVVEHLTEREQLDYLTECWRLLAPGQALIVIETPNKLSLFDDHTFELPFSHLVPDELFIHWLNSKSPDLRFGDALIGTFENEGLEGLLTKRRRLGMGVTPHVFELALGIPLNEIIVGDGFDRPMLEWFPLQASDYHLVDFWNTYSVEFPIGFARSVLSFIFRKPKSSKDAARVRQHNLKREQRIKRTYGYRPTTTNQRSKLMQYAARIMKTLSKE